MSISLFLIRKQCYRQHKGRLSNQYVMHAFKSQKETQTKLWYGIVYKLYIIYYYFAYITPYSYSMP